MLRFLVLVILFFCLPGHVTNYRVPVAYSHKAFPYYNIATSFHKWRMFFVEKWRRADSCMPKVEKSDYSCVITECKSRWTWDNTRLITYKREQQGCLWNGICMKRSKRSTLPFKGKCYEVMCDQYKRQAKLLHETNNACFSEHGCYKPSPHLIDLEAAGLKCKCSRNSTDHVMWVECKELDYEGFHN